MFRRMTSKISGRSFNVLIAALVGSAPWGTRRGMDSRVSVLALVSGSYARADDCRVCRTLPASQSASRCSRRFCVTARCAWRIPISSAFPGFRQLVTMGQARAGRPVSPSAGDGRPARRSRRCPGRGGRVRSRQAATADPQSLVERRRRVNAAHAPEPAGPFRHRLESGARAARRSRSPGPTVTVPKTLSRRRVWIGVSHRTTPAASDRPDRLSARRYASKTQSAQPA